MADGATGLDLAFWTTAGGIFFLLLCSAFFSGSETALTASSRGKLRNQADAGSRGAARALRLSGLRGLRREVAKRPEWAEWKRLLQDCLCW